MIGIKIGNLEVYGIIYKIENLVNHKVYIGQTTLNGGFKERYSTKGNSLIERVYNTYKPKTNKIKKSLYNRHLYYSIEKYGFESFKVYEIIDVAFSKTELDIKEDSWINIYDSINNGYNNMHGGSNGKMSDESKRKISISWKEKYKNGYVSPNKGSRHTKEWKQRMSIVHSGKNPFASKVVCLENGKIYDCIKDAEEELNITGISAVCRKIRKTCKNKHWMYYDEYINKTEEEIKEIINSDTKTKRKIKQVEVFKNGISLGIFESTKYISENSEKLFNIKFSSNSICRVCNGKRKHHKGYVFKYIE